jgi:uncharacterized membrane protein
MHAVLAFSTLPLLLGALLANWAYARSHEVQWTNFAAWLVTAAIALGGLALVWAAVDRLRTPTPPGRPGALYLLLLLASVVLGVANALVHAKDGWAAMPAGLVLSGVVLLIAAVASAIGLSGVRGRTA